MTLRPLRWWDISALHALEVDLFGPDGWSEALFWSELAQRESRHYLLAEELVADNRGGDTATAIVGYAGLAALAGEAFIQTIGVRRSHWGRGVGTALLRALLEEAVRRQSPQVLLEVRADNERAQELYRRFGFVPVRRRRHYYQPSGVDALVMRRG